MCIIQALLSAICACCDSLKTRALRVRDVFKTPGDAVVVGNVGAKPNSGCFAKSPADTVKTILKVQCNTTRILLDN